MNNRTCDEDREFGCPAYFDINSGDIARRRFEKYKIAVLGIQLLGIVMLIVTDLVRQYDSDEYEDVIKGLVIATAVVLGIAALSEIVRQLRLVIEDSSERVGVGERREKPHRKKEKEVEIVEEEPEIPLKTKKERQQEKIEEKPQ